MSSQIKYICSFGIWFAAIQMAGNVADGEQCGSTCAGPGDYVVQGNWIFIRQPSSAGIFITPGALGTLHHHVNIYQLFFLHRQFDQNRLSGFISFLHARWFQDMLIIQILSFFLNKLFDYYITEFWIPSIFMLLFLFFVQHVMLDGFQI